MNKSRRNQLYESFDASKLSSDQVKKWSTGTPCRLTSASFSEPMRTRAIQNSIQEPITTARNYQSHTSGNILTVTSGFGGVNNQMAESAQDTVFPLLAQNNLDDILKTSSDVVTTSSNSLRSDSLSTAQFSSAVVTKKSDITTGMTTARGLGLTSTLSGIIIYCPMPFEIPAYNECCSDNGGALRCCGIPPDGNNSDETHGNASLKWLVIGGAGLACLLLCFALITSFERISSICFRTQPEASARPKAVVSHTRQSVLPTDRRVLFKTGNYTAERSFDTVTVRFYSREFHEKFLESLISHYPTLSVWRDPRQMREGQQVTDSRGLDVTLTLIQESRSLVVSDEGAMSWVMGDFQVVCKNVNNKTGGYDFTAGQGWGSLAPRLPTIGEDFVDVGGCKVRLSNSEIEIKFSSDTLYHSFKRILLAQYPNVPWTKYLQRDCAQLSLDSGKYVTVHLWEDIRSLWLSGDGKKEWYGKDFQQLYMLARQDADPCNKENSDHHATTVSRPQNVDRPLFTVKTLYMGGFEMEFPRAEFLPKIKELLTERYGGKLKWQTVNQREETLIVAAQPNVNTRYSVTKDGPLKSRSRRKRSRQITVQFGNQSSGERKIWINGDPMTLKFWLEDVLTSVYHAAYDVIYNVGGESLEPSTSKDKEKNQSRASTKERGNFSDAVSSKVNENNINSSGAEKNKTNLQGTRNRAYTTNSSYKPSPKQINHLKSQYKKNPNAEFPKNFGNITDENIALEAKNLKFVSRTSMPTNLNSSRQNSVKSSLEKSKSTPASFDKESMELADSGVQLSSEITARNRNDTDFVFKQGALEELDIETADEVNISLTTDKEQDLVRESGKDTDFDNFDTELQTRIEDRKVNIEGKNNRDLEIINTSGTDSNSMKSSKETAVNKRERNTARKNLMTKYSTIDDDVTISGLDCSTDKKNADKKQRLDQSFSDGSTGRNKSKQVDEFSVIFSDTDDNFDTNNIRKDSVDNSDTLHYESDSGNSSSLGSNKNQYKKQTTLNGSPISQSSGHFVRGDWTINIEKYSSNLYNASDNGISGSAKPIY